MLKRCLLMPIPCALMLEAGANNVSLVTLVLLMTGSGDGAHAPPPQALIKEVLSTEGNSLISVLYFITSFLKVNQTFSCG